MITNQINGKIYIGQTLHDLGLRFRQHINQANRGVIHSLLYRAIRKYGATNFNIKEIDATDSAKYSDWLESFYIGVTSARNHDIGYNISIGGNSPMRGRNHSAKTLNEMRDGRRKGANSPCFGKPVSIEQRIKISDTLKGRPLSQEVKDKMSATNRRLGRKPPLFSEWPLEVQERVREQRKARNGINSGYYRKDLNNEELAKLYSEGVSAKELAEKFRTTEPTIRSHIRRAGGTIRPPGVVPHA